MEISEINGVPFAPAGENGVSGAAGLAETFDNFLQLLTTQLQYQDPLSPVDSNEFTNQLVQFSAVEQAIQTNSKLDKLIALQSGNQLSEAVAYIGKTIKTESSQFWLEDGNATLLYGLGGNAQQTTITIVDESGATVRVLSGETGAGLHEVTWDGTDGSGTALPDGVYTVLANAIDAEGDAVTVATGFYGRVTGIEMQDGQLLLGIGKLLLPLDQVMAVQESTQGA